MKKNVLILLLLMSYTASYSQESCGFEKAQEELERLHPESQHAREQAEAWLLSLNKQEYFKHLGTVSKNSLYTGPIYEIPVVVHVIESSDSSNTSPTDDQIKTWIANANKMYATTYGSNYYPEGVGLGYGTVIPFRLALAKRTPQCGASTGIIRYNGSTLFGTAYDQYGVKFIGANGITPSQIRNQISHWPENSYFNIYIIVRVDGTQGFYEGAAGWAYIPTASNDTYDSFMKVSAVTSVEANNSTLAHEFGHAMGLYHPFNGADSSGVNCPPSTGNCLTDDDMVCDTESTKSMSTANPFPSNTTINPCTGVGYNDIQYNIMNYTSQTRKFTPGQRDRALALFMQYKSSLTQSLGATDLAGNLGGGILTPATCIPLGINNPTANTNAGPTRVQLGTIDNTSSGYTANTNPVYYIDYSSQNCITTTVYTKIPKATPSTITVTFQSNNQNVKAWIDYNNDGTFDSSELIANSNSNVSFTTPFSTSFTPPSNAVVNTPLRMRVRTDIGDYAYCQNLNYGQVEDYTVTIIPSITLATEETQNTRNTGNTVI
jgi:hypothetical protein